MMASVIVICLIGYTGFSFWQNTHSSVSKINEVPEIKMLGVTVVPNSVVKDLTYGNVVLKGSQVINAKIFDLVVTVQNTTSRQMTNVPVELQMNLVGDDTNKVISPGVLSLLEPGGTARIAFKQIKALGDASGKSATAGQHIMTLRIKPNPEGGVEQATEASFRFNVDSTVKIPSTLKKQ